MLLLNLDMLGSLGRKLITLFVIYVIVSSKVYSILSSNYYAVKDEMNYKLYICRH